MKKRVIIHSVAIWMGASLFLYCYPALATTKIYDPMNPSETITPIPNEEPQVTQKNHGEINYEPADSTELSEASTVDSATDEMEGSSSSEETDQGDKKSENEPPKEKKSTEKATASDKQKTFIRHSATPLMLDDDFFSSPPVSLSQPSTGGEAGGEDGFSQVALSAYLLSGVALYGNSAARETKLSDSFA